MEKLGRACRSTALGSIKSVFVWGRCLVGDGSQLSKFPKHLMARTPECPATPQKQPIDLKFPILSKETEIVSFVCFWFLVLIVMVLACSQFPHFGKLLFLKGDFFYLLA